MIIDIHTHTFPDQIAASTLQHLSGKSHTTPFTDGTSEGLVRSMRTAGIDLGIVLPVATRPDQVRHINEAAAKRNQTALATLISPRCDDTACRPQILSFAAMHPDLPDWAGELEQIKAEGFRGIKIHPVYQGVDLDDKTYTRIFRRCGELGLAVITHTGFDIGFPGVVHCAPEMALHAIEEAGPFSFILGHMGGWREWDRVASLLAGTGVYLDTSFSTGKLTPIPGDDYYRASDLPMMDATAFLDLIHAFGADHILFGTDSPWSDQKESVEWMQKLPLTDSERNMILGANASHILSLN